MINALELVSISDFALSIVCLFLAGLTLGNSKTNKSPDNSLGFFILFVGLSAFMGGLNHGFFEPLHQSYYPRLLTFIFADLWHKMFLKPIHLQMTYYPISLHNHEQKELLVLHTDL